MHASWATLSFKDKALVITDIQSFARNLKLNLEYIFFNYALTPYKPFMLASLPNNGWHSHKKTQKVETA